MGGLPMTDRPALANAIAERQTRSASPRTRATVVVIKLEHLRDRPLRFAPLWKTADVGSVFRFSGAQDGFANPLASAQYWCRKHRPGLEVAHSMSVDGVLQVRFIKAEHDDEPVVRRYDGDGLTGR
jgi:hypothetical protein